MSGKDLSGSTVDHDVANKLYRINIYESFNFMKQEPNSNGSISYLIETACLIWTSVCTNHANRQTWRHSRYGCFGNKVANWFDVRTTTVISTIKKEQQFNDYETQNSVAFSVRFLSATVLINLLTPNVNYSGRTAPLTSKVAFYIFIQQI